MQNQSQTTRPGQESGPQEDNALTTPAAKEQLEAVIDILSQQNKPASITEFEELLSAVKNRLSEISAQLPEEQQALAQVTVANVESATTHPSEIERCSDTLLLNVSVFNRLAAALPQRVIKVSDLIEDWSKYQAHTNPAYINKAIARLVKCGVLEYVGSEHVRRTSLSIELKGDNDPKRTIPEHATKREPITPQQLVAHLDTLPAIENYLKPLERPYSADHDDEMRLVSACALGCPYTKVGAIWTPRISPQKVQKILKATTGMHNTPLRNKVFKTLVQEITKQLTERIGAIAIQTPPLTSQTSTARDATIAGTMVSRAAITQDTQALSELQEYFALGNQPTEEFLRMVLAQSKESLFQVLRESVLFHLTGMGRIGVRKLETVHYSQQSGETLSSAGRKFNLTREAVRQHLEHIKSIHPLVAAILEASPTPDVKNAPEITESLSTAWTQEIKRNPAEAFAQAWATSGEPLPEPEESDEKYLKRIFFEAFAGRYLDGNSTKSSFPPSLQTLQPSPKEFFRTVVYDCINHEMKGALRNYVFPLSTESLAVLYDSDTSNTLPEDRSLTLTYLRELVEHPGEGAHNIWKRIAPPNISSKDGEKIKVLLDPIYRRLGEQRAQAVCKVLSEPWCSAWLPSRPLQELIQKRILEQNSVAETCNNLSITHGSFSMIWSRVTLLMPILRNLIPRRVSAIDGSQG